jgi:prolyl-tRNA synthetase
MSKEITSRAQDYSQWYNDLILKSGLADYSAVRGCMVIKPYGLPFGRICVMCWIRCLKTRVT